jgi:hypothetical protein
MYGLRKMERKIPWKIVRQIKQLHAPLMDEAGAGAALRRAGDFAAHRENIVHHRVLKTGLGNLRCRRSRRRRGDPCVAQRTAKRTVDDGVSLDRLDGSHIRIPRDEQGISEILSMQHHAAAGPAAHRIAVRISLPNGRPMLKVTERNRRCRPPVNSQHRGANHGQKRLVDGHVQRRGMRSLIQPKGELREPRAHERQRIGKIEIGNPPYTK